MCKHFGEDKVSQKKFILNISFDFRALEQGICIQKELKNNCYCKFEIDFIVTHLYRLHFMKTRENFEKLEEEHGHFARTCMINLKEITKGISVMM